jgi:outer membrane protein
MAYYDPTHFKPGDSDSHALRQLDKRKSSHDGRAFLRA